MPVRPKSACKMPGCPNKVPAGQMYCEEHRKRSYKIQDKFRKPAHKRGYDKRWEKLRGIYLKEHPLCEECLKNKITNIADEVHHITPISKGGEILNKDNLMALCHSCHMRKHATDSLHG